MILYSTILHCIIVAILRYTNIPHLYDIILYHIILYYTILYYTILYCTILYYTILYCTVLYCTVLYYTILYYASLHHIVIWGRQPRSAQGLPPSGPESAGGPSVERSRRPSFSKGTQARFQGGFFFLREGWKPYTLSPKLYTLHPTH